MDTAIAEGPPIFADPLFDRQYREQGRIFRGNVLMSSIQFSWCIRARTDIDNGGISVQVGQFREYDLAQFPRLLPRIREEIYTLLSEGDCGWLYEIRHMGENGSQPALIVHGYILADYDHEKVLRAWVTGDQSASRQIIEQACETVANAPYQLPPEPFSSERIASDGFARMMQVSVTPQQFSAVRRYQMMGAQISCVIDVHETLDCLKRAAELIPEQELVFELCQDAVCAGASYVLAEIEQ